MAGEQVQGNASGNFSTMNALMLHRIYTPNRFKFSFSSRLAATQGSRSQSEGVEKSNELMPFTKALV